MSEEVTRELRKLNNEIRKFLSASPIKQEIEDVTGMHGWIIVYLINHDGKDIYQRDLEREFGISRSTTSKMIDCMESRGLVERVKVDYDDRLKKIVLTDKSRMLAKKIRDINTSTEQKLTDGFTQSELKTMLNYIKRMEENMKGKETKDA